MAHPAPPRPTGCPIPPYPGGPHPNHQAGPRRLPSATEPLAVAVRRGSAATSSEAGQTIIGLQQAKDGFPQEAHTKPHSGTYHLHIRRSRNVGSGTGNCRNISRCGNRSSYAVMIPTVMAPATGFLIWVRRKKTAPLTRGAEYYSWKVGSRLCGCSRIHFDGAAAKNPDYTCVDVHRGRCSLVDTVASYELEVQIEKAVQHCNCQRKTIDDTEVITLSDNTDLGTATAWTVFTTTKSIIAMRSDIAPFLTPEAILVVGMHIGATIGLLYFNLCPNQTRIRRLVSQAAKLEER